MNLKLIFSIFLVLILLTGVVKAELPPHTDEARTVEKGGIYTFTLRYNISDGSNTCYYDVLKIDLKKDDNITIHVDGELDVNSWYLVSVVDSQGNEVTEEESTDSDGNVMYAWYKIPHDGVYYITVGTTSDFGYLGKTYTITVVDNNDDSPNDSVIPGVPPSCKIPGTDKDICKTLHDWARALKNLPAYLYNGLIAVVVKPIQGFITAVTSTITNIVNTIAGIPQVIGNALSSAVNTFWNGVSAIAQAVGNFFGGIFKAIGDFFGSLGKSIQDGLNWIGKQLGVSFNWAGEQLQANAVLIIAIILIVVGIFAFRPAIILGVILLGLWGLQQLAGQGNIIQGLFGDTKNLVMIIFGLAGLAILLRR